MESLGKCVFCGLEFSGRLMANHLLECKKRSETLEAGNELIYLIEAFAGDYFVFFEASSKMPFKQIDYFLRKLWCECCGHLSAFKFKSSEYVSDSEEIEYNEKPMSLAIRNELKKGVAFIYEYDFGSTTTLRLKVIGERKGRMKIIRVLARNNPIGHKCDSCSQKAELVCSGCSFDDEKKFFCKKCAKKHECGEEMMLKTVNSPRTGVCAYVG